MIRPPMMMQNPRRNQTTVEAGKDYECQAEREWESNFVHHPNMMTMIATRIAMIQMMPPRRRQRGVGNSCVHLGGNS